MEEVIKALEKQIKELQEDNKLKEVRIQKLERDLTDLRGDFHNHNHHESYAPKENA